MTSEMKQLWQYELLQFTFEWDSAVLEYTNRGNLGLPEFDAGDFNVDFSKYSNQKSRLLSILLSFGLHYNIRVYRINFDYFSLTINIIGKI